MTGFLLDTNAVSLISPATARPSPAFARWMEEHEKLEAVYLSAATVHEMEKGVRLLEAKGATAKARLVGLFLQGLMAGYGDRILPFDAATARESGRLEAKAIAAGQSPGMADAVIAGTAGVHGLTVVTRNLKHFQFFGVPVLSPDDISWT